MFSPTIMHASTDVYYIVGIKYGYQIFIVPCQRINKEMKINHRGSLYISTFLITRENGLVIQECVQKEIIIHVPYYHVC